MLFILSAAAAAGIALVWRIGQVIKVCLKQQHDEDCKEYGTFIDDSDFHC